MWRDVDANDLCSGVTLTRPTDTVISLGAIALSSLIRTSMKGNNQTNDNIILGLIKDKKEKALNQVKTFCSET